MTTRRVFAAFSVLLILFPAIVAGQQPQPPAVAPVPSTLKIFVLTGEGAIHRLALGITTDVVVEVRGLDDFPIEGAEVVFTLPETGPGGAYRGQRQYKTTTNGGGQAVAIGFEPNGLEGRYQITVEASAGTRRGRAVVNQANSLRAIASTVEEKRKFPKRLVIIGAAAGAATAGLLLAFGGGSSVTTATLTPGAVVIGPGR